MLSRISFHVLYGRNINTTQAQQKALDDARVAPADHLEFRKCNMRLKIDIKPKEATFQVATVTIHKSSIRFTINKKKFSIDVEIFREIIQICLKLPGQQFEDLPLEQDILSFIRDLGHSGDIIYLTNKTTKATKGFRLKTLAKMANSDKKKQPAKMPKTKGLAVLFEVALTEAEQIKLATKRSKKYFHMSHASGSSDGVDNQSKVLDEQQQKVTGTNKGAGVRTKVPDVPKYDSESDKESWTFSQDEEDADEETYMNDDNGKEEEEEKVDDEEISYDQRVSTPPEYELTEEEENKDGDDKDKEGEHEQDEEDNLYKDVNINLERSDAEMTNAQANQDTKDTHVTLTTMPPVVQQQSSSVSSDLVSKFINPSPDTGIDSILKPNIQSHTLVNVSVFLSTETPSSDTTIPPPPILIIQPLQQTSESTTTTVPTKTLPDIPNFAPLFQFDQRMKEAVNVVVQLQTNKLKEEAQAENQEFLNQVDSTMKTIIKEQVQAQVSKILTKIKKYVTESLGAEVLVRSTNQPQTSYVVAASLSEFKLKNILIDKMEENKSINRSDIQKNLYNALVESYNSNKDIITSYGDVVTLKRCSDDQDKDEDPSTGSNLGSQPKSLGKSTYAEEHGQKVDDLENQTHQEFNTRNDNVTPVREALDNDDSQWNPSSSPTPDREWHKTKTVDKRPPQTWISQLAQAAGTQSSFNEFLATPIDFSAFIMNQLKIDNLTQEVLTDPTYDLIKGTFKSVVEFDKTLPLILNEQGPQVIPLDYFINNDLEYLKGDSSSHKYTTSVTKTKAADYGQVKWIENKKFYGYASNMESKHDVYSRHMIIAVSSLKIMKWFGNSHLEEIILRRQDEKLYKRTICSECGSKNVHSMHCHSRTCGRSAIGNTYRSDLKRTTPYTAYPDIQGIIYEDELNRNHLIRYSRLRNSTISQRTLRSHRNLVVPIVSQSVAPSVGLQQLVSFKPSLVAVKITHLLFWHDKRERNYTTTSPAFIEANYEALESLLRYRRRQMRNNDLRTNLEYFSEDYDEEQNIEPRTEPSRAATPPLRAVPNNIGGNLPSNGTFHSHHAQPFIPSSLSIPDRPTNSYRFYTQPMYTFPNVLVYTNPNLTIAVLNLVGMATPFVRWIEDYLLPNGLKIPSHIDSYDEKGDPDNFLHLFKGAIWMQKWLIPVAYHMFTYTLKDFSRIWWNCQKASSILDYKDLKAKFRSHFSQQKKFTKMHLVVHNIKQREGKSTRAFITRYTDDTLQILGLHEEQLISGLVHGLRTQSLVEHLSTDLPSTYKGLTEKTYTWVEAREVATNGVSNNRRDDFKRSKKFSWGATYQKLIDKVFGHQMGRNIEVNAEDMVIQTDSKEEMLADITETLERLRAITLKLNPKNAPLENSIKRQILADFLAETLLTENMEAKNEEVKRKEPEPENTWKLFTDRALNSDGSGAGLMLVRPEGKEYTYALRFESKTTNNEAKYEALLAWLRIAKEMEIRALIIFVDSQLVANQVKGLFEARQPTIKQYLEKTMDLLSGFPSYSIEHIKREQNKKADALSKLASMTFSKLAKEFLVEVIQNKSITGKGVADIVKEEGDNGMTPIQEHLRSGALPDDLQKARKLRIKAPLYKMIKEKLYRRFGKPQAIISDNGKQFVKGMFLIFYFDPKENEKRQREDMDILKERREMASIKEARYKQKLEGYYNKNVKPSTFKLGTYVVRLNNASKAVYQGKIGPTWEGPYVIRKAYGDKAYKLETLSGEAIDRT
nr:reverse transcriptase domain-containing protein [Tanacetum cinerariifolium]